MKERKFMKNSTLYVEHIFYGTPYPVKLLSTVSDKMFFNVSMELLKNADDRHRTHVAKRFISTLDPDATRPETDMAIVAESGEIVFEIKALTGILSINYGLFDTTQYYTEHRLVFLCLGFDSSDIKADRPELTECVIVNSMPKVIEDDIITVKDIDRYSLQQIVPKIPLPFVMRYLSDRVFMSCSDIRVNLF